MTRSAPTPVLPELQPPALPAGSRVGVACSGGLDSVVLLHVAGNWARRRAWRLHVLHVDHSLRPGSTGDAAFVRGLARSLGMPFVMRRLPGRPAPTAEAPLRTARYRALADMARSCGLQHLLMAHHQGDQAESVLLRILRGSGPRGLGGIPASRPLEGGCRLHRPLLDVPRRHLEEVARQAGLSWREDPSNTWPAFLRNRVRHELLPALERTDGEFPARLLALGAEARTLDGHLRSLAHRMRETLLLHETGKLLLLHREALLRRPEPLWFHLLRPHLERFCGAWDRAAQRALLPVLQGRDTAASLPRGLQARLLGRDLLVTAAAGPPAGAVTGVPLVLEDLGGALVRRQLSGRGPVQAALRGLAPRSFSVLLDPAALRGALVVRGRLPGDRYRPLGAPRSRPVRRLQAEAGVPAPLRRLMPVVCDAGGPVWSPPGRGAHRTRLGPGAAAAVLLTWESPPYPLFRGSGGPGAGAGREDQ